MLQKGDFQRNNWHQVKILIKKKKKTVQLNLTTESAVMRPSPNKVCILVAGSWLAAWAESTHCLLRPGKTCLIYAEPWESLGLLHNQKNNVHSAQSPVSVTRCFEFFSYKAIFFS